MNILFLHRWHSVPSGVKPMYLKEHGHTVLAPPFQTTISPPPFGSPRPNTISIGPMRSAAPSVAAQRPSTSFRPIRRS